MFPTQPSHLLVTKYWLTKFKAEESKKLEKFDEGFSSIALQLFILCPSMEWLHPQLTFLLCSKMMSDSHTISPRESEDLCLLDH